MKRDFYILVLAAIFAVIAIALLDSQTVPTCSTDTECMETFGGNGDPTPMEVTK